MARRTNSWIVRISSGFSRNSYCAELHRFNRHFTIVRRRDENHRQLGIDLANLAGKVNARNAWQHDIQQQDVGLILANQIDSRFWIVGKQNFRFRILERPLHQPQNRAIVINDQKFRHLLPLKNAHARRHPKPATVRTNRIQGPRRKCHRFSYR